VLRAVVACVALLAAGCGDSSSPAVDEVHVCSDLAGPRGSTIAFAAELRFEANLRGAEELAGVETGVLGSEPVIQCTLTDSTSPGEVIECPDGERPAPDELNSFYFVRDGEVIAQATAVDQVCGPADDPTADRDDNGS
jgi:hypothetical protein